jgi:hypothetical protein
MKRKRRSPTELEKRASAALSVRASDGKFILSRRECAGMTPREILREFDRRVIYAHGGAHATGGSMHPCNLWPTRRDEDARETPRDISRIAKGKRLQKAHTAHLATMAAKGGLMPVDVRGAKDDGGGRAATWPSRSFPKRETKWPKRPFPGSKADRARRRKPCPRS